MKVEPKFELFFCQTFVTCKKMALLAFTRHIQPQSLEIAATFAVFRHRQARHENLNCRLRQYTQAPDEPVGVSFRFLLSSFFDISKVVFHLLRQ